MHPFGRRSGSGACGSWSRPPWPVWRSGWAFRAGPPRATRPTASSPADPRLSGRPSNKRGRRPVLAAAGMSRRQLGLSEPASVDVEHVTDRLGGVTYDEVTGAMVRAAPCTCSASMSGAARGRRLARLAGRGRPSPAGCRGGPGTRHRPRGGSRPPCRRPAGGPAGAGRHGLGDLLAARPTGSQSPATASHRPVAHGRVHAGAYQRPLASRPSRQIDEATARAHANVALADLLGSRSGQVAITAVALGWVAPNDAFEPAAPDAPDATLRLAWVVEAGAKAI